MADELRSGVVSPDAERRHQRADKEKAEARRHETKPGRQPQAAKANREGRAMSRAFLPFSVGVGLIAGQLARKIFERIWGRVEEGEPPKPKHRDFGSWAKLIAALCVEGAVFRLVRGIADHYARRAFAAVTGSWPGEEKRNRKR